MDYRYNLRQKQTTNNLTTHLRNGTQKRKAGIHIRLAPLLPLRLSMVADGLEDAAEEEGGGVVEDDGDEGEGEVEALGVEV